MAGSRGLYQDLARRLGLAPGTTRPDGRVSLGLASCTGMCDQGPALLVNGLALTRLDATRCAAVAELVEAGTPVAEWPPHWFQIDDQIRRRDLLLAGSLTPGSALEALSRQPESERSIMRTLFIGLAMIESLCIYALVVALILIFAHPQAASIAALFAS